MMEFIRARWKLVGGSGVPGKPACPGWESMALSRSRRETNQ